MNKEKDSNPFKLINSREVYKNPWIEVREDAVIRPGGGKGIFGVVSMVPGSSVVALNEKDEIYLTKEYKYAIGKESIEIISGAIDEGESPLDAAKRELREEVGLNANKWTALGAIEPFTTVIESTNHMFFAEDLSTVDISPDDGEIIRTELIHFTQALTMVMAGEITHGASVAAILKVARLRGLN